MKKAVVLFLALMMCLSLTACELPEISNGQSETAPSQAALSSEEREALASIHGNWLIKMDGISIYQFHSDGTCTVDKVQGIWQARPVSDPYYEELKEQEDAIIVDLYIVTDDEVQTIPVGIKKTGEVQFLIYDSAGRLVSNEKIDGQVLEYLTVEISPENWSDYFQIVAEDYTDVDAFGDVVRATRYFRVQLKPQYRSVTPWESSTFFEFSMVISGEELTLKTGESGGFGHAFHIESTLSEVECTRIAGNTTIEIIEIFN